MLKDKKLLPKLINDVKENKPESLELLHYHFQSFIKKYADKYKVDIPTLEAEFDLILVYIINKGITDPIKILSYLNVCFKHFKNINIDKLFRLNREFEIIDIEDFENKLSSSTLVEKEIIFSEFPLLSNLISKEMLEILQEKFIDKFTCENIGKSNNLSKQRISQKILQATSKLKEELNYA